MDLIGRNAPAFQVCADPERHEELRALLGKRRDGAVIQMVVVVVGDHDSVDLGQLVEPEGRWVEALGSDVEGRGAIGENWVGQDGCQAGGFASNGFAEHSPGGYSMAAALTAEIVLTFAFLFVILGATDKRAPAALAPIAIGLCFTLIHLIGIPVDNLSVNPARSTGTALFAEPWALQQLWLFWVAPIIGGAIGGVVYPLVAGNGD